MTSGIYIANRHKEHSMLSKTHTQLIENRFSRSKVIQNFSDYLECGNFSQGAETPGTEKDIAF
jgi:hypothetical protein